MKDKRAIVRSIVHGAQQRFGAAAAEVDHQDKWQRADLGFAVVSGSWAHATEVLQKVERFAASFPEVAVLETAWDGHE